MLTLTIVIEEAICALTTFDEVGHANYDLKNGEGAGNPQEAEEQKEIARKEMRLIRAFIRKHIYWFGGGAKRQYTWLWASPRAGRPELLILGEKGVDNRKDSEGVCRILSGPNYTELFKPVP
ncbi:hypothetical protein [Paenibacillus polymyxa]|uniref:Uncharacterized protein n=1 Tax=Paenibacillus polymyxa TaxID=1406 RepID=A0AAP4A0Z4_PAEPO|nr:hypothetical protein [Paenibacillus polymyxa]MDH2332859.1 hypothetical protein [Paenibacillus polymyxa]